MSSDLTNSPLCREYEDGHQDLKVNFVQSVSFQLPMNFLCDDMYCTGV